MQHPKVDCIPASVMGYVYNHARKNLWRVGSWYELDDLIMDGIMIAIKCRNRYGDVSDAHLMALVKTSLYNHMVKLSRRRPNEICESDLIGNDEQDYHSRIKISEPPLQEFYTFFKEKLAKLAKNRFGLAPERELLVNEKKLRETVFND